jgi:SAM-dependent methyltransferase
MTGWRTAGPLSHAALLQQGLWGSDPDGWARFAEPHNQPLFEAILDATGTGPGTRLLDVGCGAGLLLALAQQRGATVTGLDVTPGLLAVARNRLPTAELWQADICSLPFGDAEFDVVTGVNSVQFAEDPPAALAEAARVVQPGGLVAVGNFAAPERAESTAVHRAMAALSPPQRQADHARPTRSPRTTWPRRSPRPACANRRAARSSACGGTAAWPTRCAG